MMFKTTLDEWTEIGQGLFNQGKSAAAHAHPVHACVIDGVPHFIHAPTLALTHPEFFCRLSGYAERHGICLQPDRRAADSAASDCRRKKFLSIVFLVMGIYTEGACAEEVDLSLNLIAPEYTASILPDEEQPTSRMAKLVEQAQTSLTSQILTQILLNHMDDIEQYPPDIVDDIHELAAYYAQYPAAVKLIQSIAHNEWKLKYAPHTFQTNVKGSRMDIDQVEVFFDPRSGAKLKFYDKCAEQKPFCIASPADALLHELLHVQTITNDKGAFIGQGGLDPWRYPAEHERLTIVKENALYRSMTLIDKRPRPLRSEHNGRHVLVSCATCYE
jgi:hypothetical protein